MCISPSSLRHSAFEFAKFVDDLVNSGDDVSYPPYVVNLARAYLALVEDEEADQRLRDERLAARRAANRSPDAETT